MGTNILFSHFFLYSFDAITLEQFLEHHWQLSITSIRLILNQGLALILLDGLDEVTGEAGKQITKEIKRFARSYPQAQTIVTCRTQSQESKFDRFDYVEVADFNEEQVEAFAAHWFGTVCKDAEEGKTKTEDFLSQLFREENKPIRELAITPILLSLTCAVFQQTGKFYSKRSKLYEEGLELLLKQWDQSREVERDEVYRDLSVERKLELLSYVAVKKFEQEQYVLFEQEELERYIGEFLGIERRESKNVLKAIESQHGLLIERAREIWSFSHLTFQECLVSRLLINKYHFISLNIKTPQIDISTHLPKKHWREVYLMVVVELKNPLNFIIDLQIRIDAVIKVDEDIQTYIKWIDAKSGATELPNKLPALRAFYFAFFKIYRCICARDENYELEMIYDGLPHKPFSYDEPEYYSDLSFWERESSISFGLSLYLGLHLGVGAGTIHFCSIDSVSKLLSYKAENNIKQIRINFCVKVVLDIAENLSQGKCLGGSDSYHAIDSFHFYLKYILEKISQIDFNMRDELQRINNKIPEGKNTYDIEKAKKNREFLDDFWKSNGISLLAQLRNIFIEYRQIGYNWQFNEVQEQRLEEYYFLNKLLLDCISQSNLDLDEKEIIHSKILLPIAEIEKRKQLNS